MDKKYLIVFGIYLVLLFCANGYLVIVVSDWLVRALLIGSMVLIGFLSRYLLKLLS